MQHSGQEKLLKCSRTNLRTVKEHQRQQNVKKKVLKVFKNISRTSQVLKKFLTVPETSSWTVQIQFYLKSFSRTVIEQLLLFS